MAKTTATSDIRSLVGRIANGEIRLPEIQRGYVWKPTQVATLIDSLYRNYPSGALLLWQTTEMPEQRPLGANAPTAAPLSQPLYLLDGQQRLTSLYRVFTDDPRAQIVFNVEREAFQNQSAATAKDPRWVKVHEVLTGRRLAILQRLSVALPHIAEEVLESRIEKLSRVGDYSYHLEILSELSYQEVTEIFVRVNSRGRALKATDLALATLSARWPGVLNRLEAEAEKWAKKGYDGLDVGFLTRALTAAVLQRGLSQWSLGRLTTATDDQLEAAWQVVQRGLSHLVPLLQNNLRVTHSSLLPSVLVLVPLVIYLGSRPDEPLAQETADGLLYWFLVATMRNRYSGSTDTVLSQDVAAARQAEPVRALMDNLGLLGSRPHVTEQAIAGRGAGSPYFFLSFLVCQRNGARDWWYGAEIAAGAEGSQQLQYHHIHPRATLRSSYSKQEINDLANLAFISGKANLKISSRSPSTYFPEVGNAELAAHYVPLDESLRTAQAYPRFVQERRRLLAAAMNELLDSYRPSWLDATATEQHDPLAGETLDLELFASDWDESMLVVTAVLDGSSWRGTVALSELERALDDASNGVAGDVSLGEQQAAVRPVEERIEVELGPFVVTGTSDEWRAALKREREDARALSDLDGVVNDLWEGDRRPFPITSSE